jgi:hypothetical protein
LRRLAAAALWLAAGAAHADSVQLAAQNDSGFATDRGYTSGVRLSRLWETKVRDVPRWELGVLQQIFTPDTRQDPSARLERPYAGRLVLYGARHAAGPGRIDTLEAFAGMAGPSALGKQSQQLFHHVISSPETDWSRQLHDRFDGGVGATVSRTLWSAPSWPLRVAGHAGATAGTVLGFGHAGLELRWGAPEAPWSEALRLAPTPVMDAGRGGGFSAFAGANVRGVFRNRLLERNADDPGRPIDRERTVRRVAAGVAHAAHWGAVTLAIVLEGHEYTRQPYESRFWSLSLALPLD